MKGLSLIFALVVCGAFTVEGAEARERDHCGEDPSTNGAEQGATKV